MSNNNRHHRSQQHHVEIQQHPSMSDPNSETAITTTATASTTDIMSSLKQSVMMNPTIRHYKDQNDTSATTTTSTTTTHNSKSSHKHGSSSKSSSKSSSRSGSSSSKSKRGQIMESRKQKQRRAQSIEHGIHDGMSRLTTEEPGNEMDEQEEEEQKQEKRKRKKKDKKKNDVSTSNGTATATATATATVIATATATETTTSAPALTTRITTAPMTTMSTASSGSSPGTMTTFQQGRAPGLRLSKSEGCHAVAIAKRLDKYGFILNMDSQGKVYHDDGVQQNHDNEKDNSISSNNNHSSVVQNDSNSSALSQAESMSVLRRERKWYTMMATWDLTQKRRKKKLSRALRKGIPDSLRGNVWSLLGNVHRKIREANRKQHLREREQQQQPFNTIGMDQNTGTSSSRNMEFLPYEMYVAKSLNSFIIDPANMNPNSKHAREYNKANQGKPKNSNSTTPMLSQPPPPPGLSRMRSESLVNSTSFHATQETIERDIHRTYPRHHMFHEDEDDSSDTPSRQQNGTDYDDFDDDEDDMVALDDDDVNSILEELSKAPMDPEDERKCHRAATAVGAAKSPTNFLDATGGQAALRRVLRAYSVHDRDVGYCQGMNFIAGMFLTFMNEEQAFWLLVFVMNDAPCRIRGLFGEGMKETHMVLYIAEKLTYQFLPKLAKHMEAQSIHITMYATQWLLTLYTSSFQFDLVTRVWDCFLAEGYKIVYRTMLALLQESQATLLQLSFEEILAYFRELPKHTDGNLIVDVALKIPLRRKHLAKYEKDFLMQQEQQEAAAAAQG